MTKPIPAGGERKRPARSCVLCRASKLKCGAVPAASDGDGPAQVACARCLKSGLVCEFVSLRRKGRPRRLPKPDADATVKREVDEEELVEGDDWSGGEDGEVVGASPSVGTIASRPPIATDRPDVSLAALAQGYLDNTYPFLPILPEDLSTLITYLGSATSHLQLAVATMVWPHAPLTLPHLDLLAGDSIADVQAAIFFTYASYGRAEYGNARIFLAWVGARCLANGWNLVDSPQAPPRTPVDREHIRRIFYEAWGLEVILSMQTGVRAFVLQPEPFEVDVPEPFATESSPNGLKIRALSLVAAASEPPSPSSAPAASLDSVAAICASIGLLGHQAYHTASTIVDRESAFQATMLASAALIHVVAASYASSGFTCGLDPTVKPTPHSRELITTSSNMIFSTLRESLAPHLPRTLHSPFWGCALLGASHGLLLALNTDDGTADGDSGMADEGDEWRRSALVMHLEIADWVLTEHSTMWPSVARVAQDVKTLRSVFLGDILSDDANLIMSSFPDSSSPLTVL